MSAAEDTEITLGTGKMLALFFGLVALCGAFFGIGFKMGRNSVTPAVSVLGTSATTAVSNPALRPSAVKSANDSSAATAPDVAFYKSTGQNPASAQPAAEPAGASTPAAEGNPTDNKAAADSAATPPASSYYVQVAAVSKQEDGDALVDALKKKQYQAFATAGPDKLFHVQVGPFSDLKSAEDTRSKLVGDGYNPILKK
jgi:DedD protein